MLIRIVSVVVSSVFAVLAATSADAGKPLGSAPTRAESGDILQCVAVNIGTKDLSHVRISIYNISDPDPEGTHSCSPLEPKRMCGFQTAPVGAGFRFCVIEAKGKVLRGNFCNLGTDKCFPIE